MPSFDVGLEEFAQQLEEWNKSLVELEDLLNRNFSQTKAVIPLDEGLDEVDAVGFGFRNAELIYERVDETLNNVVSKISHLRYGSFYIQKD